MPGARRVISTRMPPAYPTRRRLTSTIPPTTRLRVSGGVLWRYARQRGRRDRGGTVARAEAGRGGERPAARSSLSWLRRVARDGSERHQVAPRTLRQSAVSSVWIGADHPPTLDIC